MSGIFINSDAWNFWIAKPEQMTAEGIRADVDFYTAGGGVEAIFYNMLAEKFETLQENYNRGDDENKAPVRADILEMIENLQEFFDGVASSGCDIDALDGDLLRECAAISLRLDRTLQMLNDPAYTPSAAEADSLGSAVDTELDRMEEILEILGSSVNK